jgi:hypothetical protein
MSELVNRIKSLRAYILELEQRVADERKRYAEEVDHSENMAFILSEMPEKNRGDFSVPISRILQEHLERREGDAALPGLPRTTYED